MQKNNCRDEWGRKETEIVAIDALPGARSSQFKQEKIFRELNKVRIYVLLACLTFIFSSFEIVAF